jgi:hypothetical protein
MRRSEIAAKLVLMTWNRKTPFGHPRGGEPTGRAHLELKPFVQHVVQAASEKGQSRCMLPLGIAHCADCRRVFHYMSARKNLQMGCYLRSDKASAGDCRVTFAG